MLDLSMNVNVLIINNKMEGIGMVFKSLKHDRVTGCENKEVMLRLKRCGYCHLLSRNVITVFVVRMKKFCILGFLKCGQ